MRPLLQASRGRAQPGSPRRRRLRLLGTAVSALAAAAIVVAAARALLSTGGNGYGGGGGTAAGGGEGSSAEPWTVRGLEQAHAHLATSSNPAVAKAEADALAEAQKRARKAASLPPPQFRSNSAGVVLSPGAAEAAAACAGERCELVRRFVLAAGEAARLADSGGCAVQHCPDALGIGLRPLPYSSHAFGNRCEPLWTRAALEAVRQVISPGWRVLEWLTGGSTAWFLGRGAELTSIEGAQGFAAKASAVAAAQFEQPFLDAHWQLRVAPPSGRVLTFQDTESAEVWADYCGAAFLPAGARFDLVAVQGFARMACLRRAVQLLAPQGGLLVLPQAQRPAYREAAALVPPHWLRLTDSHSLGTTHVWMSLHPPGSGGGQGGGGGGGGSSSGSGGSYEAAAVGTAEV